MESHTIIKKSPSSCILVPNEWVDEYKKLYPLDDSEPSQLKHYAQKRLHYLQILIKLKNRQLSVEKNELCYRIDSKRLFILELGSITFRPIMFKINKASSIHFSYPTLEMFNLFKSQVVPVLQLNVVLLLLSKASSPLLQFLGNYYYLMDDSLMTISSAADVLETKFVISNGKSKILCYDLLSYYGDLAEEKGRRASNVIKKVMSELIYHSIFSVIKKDFSKDNAKLIAEYVEKPSSHPVEAEGQVEKVQEATLPRIKRQQ